jgi:hypothetical protein
MRKIRAIPLAIPKLSRSLLSGAVPLGTWDMQSDFFGARMHLDQAFDHLHGDDQLSVRAREALALLIEALIEAEHSRSEYLARILPFPKS